MPSHPADELFYDEECPVCRATVRAVLRLARSGSIRAVGLRSARAREVFADESLQERLGEFHFVASDGRRWKGPAAIPPLLERVRGGRPMARVLRRSGVAKRASEVIYHWVTCHRGRLARFVPARWGRPLEEQGPSLS